MTRKSAAAVLAALATLAPAMVASAAPEKQVCLVSSRDSCPDRVEFSVATAEFKPRQLPKKAMLPVAVHFRAALATPDGKVPSPLKTIEVALDKNTSIDVGGLQACSVRVLKSSAGHPRSQCRGSIVGTGVAHVTTDSLQPPVALPLTLFNGGFGEGATTLFIWSAATGADPRPLLAVAKLRKRDEGRYATTGLVEISPLAGGAGSVLGLRLDLRRGYVKARCFDGRLQTLLTLGLASGLRISGALIQACQTRMGTNRSGEARITKLGDVIEGVLAAVTNPGLSWKSPKKDRRNGL